MPFYKYFVEPVEVAKFSIPEKETNCLECISNITLANLNRQIKSLAILIEKILLELNQEINIINTRSKNAFQRIEKIKGHVANLDFKEEWSVNSGSIHFENNITFDSQLFNKLTRSSGLQVLYENAEKIPDLEKFDQFRLVSIFLVFLLIKLLP